MKLTTTTVATALFGSALGASTGSAAAFDVNEVCTNSCQSATDAQRDTCMQMCRQFAEQGIQFLPASTTHGAMTVTVTASQKAKTSAATPVHSAASQSMQESLFSSSGVSHDSASASAEARSDKDRLKGEDNDEDDSSAGNNSSESSSEMMSSAAAAARLSAAALLVGLSCAAFF